MKKEQVAGIEQTKQEGSESPNEPIIQLELETLDSFETQDEKQLTVSLPTETKQQAEMKHVPELKKESREPVKFNDGFGD